MASMGSAADPRLSITADALGSYPDRVLHSLYDSNVKFEEYIYYAKLTRQAEETISRERQNSVVGMKRFVPGMQSGLKFLPFKKNATDEPENMEVQVRDEKTGETMTSHRRSSVKDIIDDSEWIQASRAARTASWSAIFWLITTDILGPFTAPWAFSQLGFGPGAALYIVFGALAGYSGYQLWTIFLGLDSDRYPIKNYGDQAYRIFGTSARYFVNVLQSLQFFMNVALIILGNAIGLSQVITGAGTGANLCFVVCSLVFTIAGFLCGQVRTLQRFAFLANIAVWLNIITMILTLALSAQKPINYQSIYTALGLPKADGQVYLDGYFGPGGVTDPYPVALSAGTPSGLTFQNNIVGLMQAVFSYGGATLFCELMAEMRRPWDFWKALLAADTFIFCVYVFYGMFVYGMQGQFTNSISYQGITPYGVATANNIMQIFSSLIAAALYGNIGIKVLYANIGRTLLKFPALESTKGKLLWVGLTPAYWIAAFAVASSIPQFTNLSGLVAAVCILQFTYTFPPLLSIGYNCQKDSITADETFDPNTGLVNRVDSGFKRFARGFKVKFFKNTWDTFYFLGSLTVAVLGTYSAIYNMIQAYAGNPGAIGWSCSPPQ